MRKGQIWVSAVLYLLIGSIIIVLILQAGLPIMQKSREKAVFNKARDQFVDLNQVVDDVIEEGSGSQRVVPLDIPDGKVTLKDDTLRWEMESDTKILEPGSQIEIGNVKVVTNVDVNAYDYGSYFTLENSHIRVNISKIGSEDSHSPIDMSEIIENFYSIDAATDVAKTGEFSFVLDNNPATATGTGYTELVPAGNHTNIDRAKVLVHMFNAGGHDYTLSFTLESSGDYLRIDVKDFK